MAENKKAPKDFMKKKMYDVTITLDPQDLPEDQQKKKIKNVGLIGEFLFYRSNLKDHTDEVGMVEQDQMYPPASYEEGMSSIAGRYYEEMSWNRSKGVYEITLRLPAGVYAYGFVINGELVEAKMENPLAMENLMTKDGAFHSLKEETPWILDPKNMPYAPTKDGYQLKSELYVGSPEEVPQLPARDMKVKGTLTYISYDDILGEVRTLGVYLPAGYDRNGEYPLILASHGGAGNEVDWFSQGGLANIMDNLIAGKQTEPAIVVTMNNSVYDWDFAMIDQNVIQCILPLLRQLFAVTDDPMRMAYCGLSLGSMTAMYTYMHHPELFHYFGAFSGGFAGGEGFTLENPLLKDVKLLIGSGEEDFAYNDHPIGIPATMRALKEKGLPFVSYFVPGSHDWYTWGALFEYFAQSVLWK